MVKYCNRECQIAHRPQHKKECRRHAAELHDERLFNQPSPEEDCPLCFLTLPILNTGKTYMSCCGKMICSGCTYAPVYDDQGNVTAEKTCPFCRVVAPRTDEEAIEWNKKRAELDDPIAIYNLGCYYEKGRNEYRQDYTRALELYHQAGDLGYAQANSSIGYAYEVGQGVEVDKKKAIHYCELAAIRGCATARHNLGIEEENACNFDRALKHHIIAATGGYADSLNEIKELYSRGHATKEDYTKALQSTKHT